MIYITSHGFEFGVDTENDRNEMQGAAADAVKAAFDAMPAERVALAHSSIKAVRAEKVDDFSYSYYDAMLAATGLSENPDFIVTIEAY